MAGGGQPNPLPALRYALAALDILRTPTLEAELAAAVGQQIRSAKVNKRNLLIVTLAPEDRTSLELSSWPRRWRPAWLRAVRGSVE